MKLLAIDTATNACSAAVWDGRRIAAHRSLPMARGHAEALMPMIGEVLEAASCEDGVGGMDAIAATVGPGAFTGVRIGLAAARAMALAAGLPVLGLTTLEVVAHSQDAVAGVLLVAIDSKRADVYAQAFDANGLPVSAPAALMPELLPQLLPAGVPVAVAGDARGLAAAALAAAGWPHHVLDGPELPDAAVVARLAAARWRRSLPPADASPPAPLYLRPPDVAPPRPVGPAARGSMCSPQRRKTPARRGVCWQRFSRRVLARATARRRLRHCSPRLAAAPWSLERAKTA